LRALGNISKLHESAVHGVLDDSHFGRVLSAQLQSRVKT
jgi:hypothetical protein